MRVRLVKQFLLLGIFALGAISVSGQSIKDAIQAYNNAATNYKQDPEKALQDIQSALQISEQLGEEGSETKQNCEELIPTIYFQVAMAKYKAKDLKATLENLEKRNLQSNIMMAQLKPGLKNSS